MTERLGLRAVRAIGIAGAGLLLVAGGAFAADRLANTGIDDSPTTPTLLLAPAVLPISGTDDGPDITNATDDLDDDATESPDATDDLDDDATESPDATDDDLDDDGDEPSDDPGQDSPG